MLSTRAVSSPGAKNPVQETVIRWVSSPGASPAFSSAAEDVIRPDNMVWVVVGDRDEIESNIEALGYGDIVLMDADGNVVGETGE